MFGKLDYQVVVNMHNDQNKNVKNLINFFALFGADWGVLPSECRDTPTSPYVCYPTLG